MCGPSKRCSAAQSFSWIGGVVVHSTVGGISRTLIVLDPDSIAILAQGAHLRGSSLTVDPTQPDPDLWGVRQGLWTGVPLPLGWESGEGAG